MELKKIIKALLVGAVVYNIFWWGSLMVIPLSDDKTYIPGIFGVFVLVLLIISNETLGGDKDG